MLLLKNGPVAKVCMSASYQLGNLDWSSIETVVPNDLIVGPIRGVGLHERLEQESLQASQDEMPDLPCRRRAPRHRHPRQQKKDKQLV